MTQAFPERFVGYLFYDSYGLSRHLLFSDLSYRYYPDSTMVEMTPQYLFSKDKIREHRQAMESRVKKPH